MNATRWHAVVNAGLLAVSVVGIGVTWVARFGSTTWVVAAIVNVVALATLFTLLIRWRRRGTTRLIKAVPR